MEPSTPLAWLSTGGLALAMAGVALILARGTPRLLDLGRRAGGGERRPGASVPRVELGLVLLGVALRLIAGWLRGG